LINFRQLEAFRAVMLTKTATEAATLLHTSQPAISRLIRDLERSSKLKLFELRRRRLVATPEALALYREIERSYSGLDRVNQTIASLRDSGVGRLAIGTLPSLNMSVMPRAIRAFLRTHAGVRVSLSDRSDLVRDGVASGRLDIGFCAEEFDKSGVECQAVATAREVCVMEAGHKLSRQRTVRAADLAGVPLIMINRTDLARRRIDQQLEAAGIPSQPVIETNAGATVCSLALEGVGVGLVNALIASDFMPRGLVVKPFEPAISFDIFVLHPLHSPPSQLARKFAACVRAELRRRPGITLL
jgi:DNA-binding transcriptional LysR family regulator